MIKEKTYRALKIFTNCDEGYIVGQFAKIYFQDEWSNGRARRFIFSSANFLGRLKKQGFLKRTIGFNNGFFYKITESGIKAIKEYENEKI